MLPPPPKTGVQGMLAPSTSISPGTFTPPADPVGREQLLRSAGRVLMRTHGLGLAFQLLEDRDEIEARAAPSGTRRRQVRAQSVRA